MSHPYSVTCVFPSKRRAGKAFQVLRDLIYQMKDNELSVYRLDYQGRWYVVVVGKQPEPSLHRQVHTLLQQHKGKGARLPVDMIASLFKRRAQQLEGGKTWVEQHAEEQEEEP